LIFKQITKKADPLDKKGSVFGSVSFKKVQKRIESIKQKTLFLQRFRNF
jgi:hypothetical protein